MGVGEFSRLFFIRHSPVALVNCQKPEYIDATGGIRP